MKFASITADPLNVFEANHGGNGACRRRRTPWPPGCVQRRVGRVSSDSAAAAPASSAQQKKMAAEVAELKLSVENLERERDFYYQKLREVEVLCQQHEDSGETPPFLQVTLTPPPPPLRHHHRRPTTATTSASPPPPHLPPSCRTSSPSSTRPTRPTTSSLPPTSRWREAAAAGRRPCVGARRGQYLCAAARL